MVRASLARGLRAFNIFLVSGCINGFLVLEIVITGGMEEYSFAKSTDLEIPIHVRMFVHLLTPWIDVCS